MADKLIGTNYITPDLVAKVTGKARYAEDFRAEGMLFAKLLLSPMPHARVRNIDASAALAMEGVEAVLTADDLPAGEPGDELGLTMEPLYEGEPILAVAATDESLAADAIERIKLDLEPLPFAVEPLQSLHADGANARLEGNTFIGRDMATVKWTAEDFRDVAAGRIPMTAEYPEEWSLGDVEAGLAAADLVLDETSLAQSTSHQPLETRSAMAYWQNGKLYMHMSTQSVARTRQAVAQWVGIEPENVVLISEYCGGGFGSKIGGYVFIRIPAFLSQKTGRPVMMRITRQEENYLGRARPGFQGRFKIGFRRDGRITAMDMCLVQDNGPYGRQGDFLSSGRIASLAYQPESIRFRGITVITNTPPRAAQRAPGGLQITSVMEPLLHKAARQLGIDQVELRRINAPSGKAEYGPAGEDGTRRHVTSAFVTEALEKGKTLFDWDARKSRSGQRTGSKVTGLGVAVSPYVAGSMGYDGLFTIRPDGKMYVQQGIGNLGTHSVFDTARSACDVLGFPWDQVEVAWGNTARNLPWSSSQSGSQTTHAHTRANYAAGLDAKQKLQEIAARDLGGSADQYDVGPQGVFRTGNPSRRLSFAQAARRAIQLGGKYDGHELPEDVNPMTVASAQALAGLGLMGVAKDNFGRDGDTYSFAIGMAEVEVDVETGHVDIKEYAVTADVGTVVNPRGLAAQLHGGGVQGMGHARSQKWAYDQHWGRPVAKRFYSNKPPTMLDVPLTMTWDAVGEPDPESPVGAKGIGEPSIGAGAGAVLNAIADAVGDDHFRRLPVTPDMIVSALDGRGSVLTLDINA